MNNKIGIIVPVYKVEKYIAECIDSILAQTYKYFRLILVDDGSPDNAGKICDEYAQRDLRITVIHQENAGAGQARARGVEEAKDCQFITFVDSDDTIASTFLETLYKAVRDDIDIIISHFDTFANIGTDFIPIETYRHYLLTELYISPGPCCKLFRKSLFNNFTFHIPRNIVIAEDVIMNIRLSFNTCRNVRFIEGKMYNYRRHPESTYHSHIRTPENEQAIQEQRIKSIPKNEINKYIRDTITIRLLRFREFWGYKCVVKGMKETEFYKQLRKDVRKCKYKMNFIDKIIFNYSNPIIRVIAINVKKAVNIANKKEPFTPPRS